ncbi:MAG: cation acetate symporter [Bacteroidetes bacterium]|nr:MAG: cation acetate symporter [Bacteroidota bacterium]
MDTTTLIFLFVGTSFLLYTVIAWKSRVSSTKDFYVAGGGVSPLANGLATAADFMSVAAMLSVPGIIATQGYDAAVYLIGPPGGFVLLGMLIAPYLRRFGRFTMIDFIGDRYYSNTARTVAIVCALFVSLTYLAGQMRGVGVVFSRFLEVEINTGVVIGALIVLIYAVLGGMKGITYTQVAQFCVLAFAFLTPIIFMSILLTHNPVPFLGWGGKTADGSMYMLDKLDGLSQEFGFKAFTTQGKPTIELVCIGLTLMFGTASMPHIVVRFFTVPRMQDVRTSVFYTLLFIGIVFLCMPPAAAFSRAYILEAVNHLAYTDVPGWFTTWEKIGLLQFTDLNGDGIIQHVSGPQNELRIDNDIIFLAIPEIARLSNWVVALVAAGTLAAALSTAAGLLLVISTAVSHDLLKKQIWPDLTETRELQIARICAAGAVAIGIYFGMHPPSFIIETIALAFSIAASVFFPVIVLGIFRKRTNREGAIAGMLAGLVFSVSYIVYYQFLGGKANGYWLDITPQGIGAVGMLLNFAVTIGIGALFPPPPAHVREMVEEIRYPM